VLTVTKAPDLAAVRALADEVVAHDGGRLKLELDYVASNPIDVALWHEGDRLVGYAGYYRFGGAEPEIAGMVAPGARCHGIGTHLLTPLLAQAHEQGCPTALLVVPAGTEAGAAFASAHGAGHAFSEHHLVLGETPVTAEDPATVLRPATTEDLPALERIVAAAFEEEPRPIELDRSGDSTYAIEHGGAVVGHVRLSVAEGWGGVYGFAVDPAVQGRGIGRDVLARCARLLRADGRDTVTLEVETENAGALHLYTSTGFVRDAGEDYWRLAT
jgi:ribosomal protein S18 acetylase RimI-like enzyme